MRPVLRALTSALALLSAPVCAAAQDAASVIAAERAFAADFPALGLAGSFSKWSRPDAVMISGGQAATVAAVFEGAPRTRQPGEALIEWWPTFAGVARSGEMGFTAGPAWRDRQAMGHYFTVWVRQPDGVWRWVYDGGSNADPVGQAAREADPRLLPTTTVGSASAEAAMAEVREAESALAAAARMDQKAAHLAVMADEGRLYVAPSAPAEGADAFAHALDAWPASFDFGPTEGGGASRGGDMAWTYGPAAWTRDDVARRGHYMRLWQKRPEGWRLVMAQLIPAPNAAPPPAGG